MSYCSIDYSKKNQTLTIENRFFADDFQKCMNKEYNQMYDLMHYHSNKELRAVVDKYTNSHLKIKWNDKVITFNCTNSQYSEDANLFYFKYTFSWITVKSKNTLAIENTILLKYFNDQKNGVVLNLSTSIADKIIEFDQKKTTETIQF